MNSQKLKNLEFEFREFSRMFSNLTDTVEDANKQLEIMKEMMKLLSEKMKNMRGDVPPQN